MLAITWRKFRPGFSYPDWKDDWQAWEDANEATNKFLPGFTSDFSFSPRWNISGNRDFFSTRSAGLKIFPFNQPLKAFWRPVYMIIMNDQVRRFPPSENCLLIRHAQHCLTTLIRYNEQSVLCDIPCRKTRDKINTQYVSLKQIIWRKLHRSDHLSSSDDHRNVLPRKKRLQCLQFIIYIIYVCKFTPWILQIR